jgi:hypothetical protein
MWPSRKENQAPISVFFGELPTGESLAQRAVARHFACEVTLQTEVIA